MMTTRNRHFLMIGFLALLLSCCLSAHATWAQEPLKNDAGAAQPRAAEKNPEEAATKDGGEAEQIKNAPAVRWIARHTGLSNTQAYWISVVLNFAIIVAFWHGSLKKSGRGCSNPATNQFRKELRRRAKPAKKHDSG
jgi:hypothetical protein